MLKFQVFKAIEPRCLNKTKYLVCRRLSGLSCTLSCCLSKPMGLFRRLEIFMHGLNIIVPYFIMWLVMLPASASAGTQVSDRRLELLKLKDRVYTSVIHERLT